MSRGVEIAALQTFEVAPDGTLPRMAVEALHRRCRDNTLRIVYPAASWTIERNTERGETFILTLATPDGFEVSFALSRGKLEAIAETIAGAGEERPIFEPTLSLN